MRRSIKIYTEKKHLPISRENFSERSDIVFVGGFSHKPNLDGIVWFLNEVFPKLDKNIRVHIVGSNTPQQLFSFACPEIIIHGFVDDIELEKIYGSCRLVIVPLRYGAGVKGKLIEALFHSLPVVTTTIGAEGIDDIESVIPVTDDPVLFAKTINRLNRNTSELVAISEKICDYINNNFSIEATRKIIQNDVNL